MAAETDLTVLLRGLDPVIAHPEVVVVEAEGAVMLPALALVHEEEGTTLVLRRSDAEAAGHRYDGVFAWITLRVHSSLEAVGLTAAFSSALAARGIGCNVLAGARHDHLLVPRDRAVEAIATLRELAEEASARGAAPTAPGTEGS